jgi:flagellar export protein FliJ
LRKFVFTLHALLHLKESVEKQERHNLGMLSRRLHDLEAEREDLLRRRGAASEACAAKLRDGMSAAGTQKYTDYFRMLKDLLAEKEREIEDVQREIEECRRRLVEVLREIRMLENLREKQYAEYMQEVRVEEERTINDFVSYQVGQSQQEKQA